MGKNKIAPNDEDGLVDGVRNLTQEESDALEIRDAELKLKFGNGKDYNRERVMWEIDTISDDIHESYIEVGKRLVFLKAKEPHGEYMKCLERLNISARSARELSSIARKFVDEGGNSKWHARAALPRKKMLALVRLNDSELNDLQEKGEIEGLTQDEIRGMTTRELNARIKELKSENTHLREETASRLEAKDELLAEKNKKIDNLTSMLRVTTDPARWQETACNYLHRLQALAPNFSRAVGEFAEIITGINEMKVGDWDHSQIVLMQQAGHTFQVFSEAFDALGRQLDFSGPYGNAVFHRLNDLQLAIEEDKKAKVDG